LDGLIVGLRLGYNNEMGLNRNTVGWRGHLLGREWGPLVGCSLRSDTVIYLYYTGRARSRLASMHKKTERTDAPVLTILTDYLLILYRAVIQGGREVGLLLRTRKQNPLMPGINDSNDVIY
jgi:hypothetical protein